MLAAFLVWTAGFGASALPWPSQSERLVDRSAAESRDMTGDPRVTVRVLTDRDTYFALEPFRVRLRIDLDPEFVSGNMVQLFARELDVPVQVRAPWLDDLRGATTVSPAEGASEVGPRATLVVNERVTEAARAPESLTGSDRRLTLYVERVYAAEASGKLAIPEALLSFAFATEFDQDFVNGRVAKNRVDAFVRSNGLDLQIRPLPDADRPAEFSGAVGRFTIDADVSTRTVAVGESLKLTLRIEAEGGDGNLHSFAAPSLPELSAFDVRGTIDAKEKGRRIITYDIAPRDTSVTEVPALTFAYFDPTPPASYRVLKTPPIRIDVRRSQEPVREERSTAAARQNAPPARRFAPALWIALIVPLVTAIVIAMRIKRRGEPPRA